MQRLNPEIPIERVWKFGPQRIIDGVDYEFHISIGNAPSEDAKPQCIRRCHDALRFKTGCHNLGCVHLTAIEYREVAGGMVSTLGRHHHGDSCAFDYPGVIGADRLLFDHRYTRCTVMLADSGCSLSP